MIGMRGKFAKGLLIVATLTLCAAASTPMAGAAADKAESSQTQQSDRIITQEELDRADITSKADAQAIATETAARYRDKHGIPLESKDLRVIDLKGNGSDLLVLPVGQSIRSIHKNRTADGNIHVGLAVMTPSTSVQRSTTGGVSVMASQWNWVAGACFTRIEGTTGWIDHCYKMHQWSNSVWTNNGWRDVYALHHYATARSKYTFDLVGAAVWNGQNPAGSAMEWADWQPRSDRTGSCDPVSLAFAIEGVTVSHTATNCDKWSITKYATAGVFRNDWKGLAYLENREVAYGVEVYVPVGGWPQWYLYADYYTG